MGDWELLEMAGADAAGRLLARGEVPAACPWFDGHFPSRPILPGVAMLDATIELLARASGSDSGRVELCNVRFRQLTGPGAVLAATVSPPAADGRRRFELTSDGAPACSGTLRFVEGTP